MWLAALLLLLQTAPAQGEVAQLDVLVQQHMRRPGAVGLSVAVARGDELVYARACGFADLEFAAPADEQTMFRIASITKQFTAVAILKLAERGKLALDDPLTRFLPEFPRHEPEITLRNLLTHTSGVQNVTDLASWPPLAARELSHEEMLALWKDLPLEFPPGQRWRYVNSGYFMLGMVIERVSGQSYGDFLRTEFFEPLRMTRTCMDSNAEVLPSRAQGYSFDGAAFHNDEPIGMGNPFSAGALLSTAGDLVRWESALTAGRVLRPESFAEMQLPFVLDDGSEPSYGIGFFLSPVAGHACLSHQGDINGFNSFLAYFPEERLSIAVLSNGERLSSEALVAELVGRLLSKTK